MNTYELFQIYGEKCFYENNDDLFLHDDFMRVCLLIIMGVLVSYYYYLKYKHKRYIFKYETYFKNDNPTNIIEEDMKLLDSNEKYIIFNFIGTSKKCVINWADYEFMEENYFSNLVKYSEKNIIIHNTDEDYDIVKYLFMSIKYRKILIDEYINNKTQLYYVEKLLEKWAINDSLINEYIIKKKNECDYKDIHVETLKESMNILSNKKTIFLNHVFNCENCKCGFTEITNHENACKYHTKNVSSLSNRWECCGNNREHAGCKVGYHVKKFNKHEVDNIRMIYDLCN